MPAYLGRVAEWQAVAHEVHQVLPVPKLPDTAGMAEQMPRRDGLPGRAGGLD